MQLSDLLSIRQRAQLLLTIGNQPVTRPHVEASHGNRRCSACATGLAINDTVDSRNSNYLPITIRMIYYVPVRTHLQCRVVIERWAN